ncbi:hypothetical protein GCM10025868_29980 [Angustibacter aerolatus]|uniref:Uncharacterized protein n=1 Tax=Angustibacter aerolatus TaxID=1162965 RepID=A0ABQ6JHR7_9ACTN|nr:hypothetical protein GCM10025868_29980 [Angustibacter aerolatus]
MSSFSARRVLPASLAGMTLAGALLVAAPVAASAAAPCLHDMTNHQWGGVNDGVCDDAFTVVSGSSTLLDVAANDSLTGLWFGTGQHIHLSPQHGSVGYAPSGFVYTPNPGFVGTDTFRYADDDLDYEALVTVTVVSPGPSATAVGASETGTESGVNPSLDVTPPGWVSGVTAEPAGRCEPGPRAR